MADQTRPNHHVFVRQTKTPKQVQARLEAAKKAAADAKKDGGKGR